MAIMLDNNVMTLAGEEMTRPLAFGANWNTVRLGILCAVPALPHAPTVNMLGNTLALGVCSGTDRPYNSSNTRNFVGQAVGGGGYAIWAYTYDANSGNPVFYSTNAAGISKFGGATYISSVNPGRWNFPIKDQGTFRRGLMGVAVTKGAPNYTVTCYIPQLALTADANLTDLIEFVEAGTVRGAAVTSGAAVPPASEAAGALDTFDLYWSRTGCPLHVYGFAVARLA